MSTTDLIFRVIAVPIVVLTTAITTAVGWQVLDGFYLNMHKPADSLGWPDGTQVLFFVSLALIGIILVAFVWLWVAPVRDDVRQDVRQGPF